MAALLDRIGASADQVSVAGFVVNVGAAALVVAGQIAHGSTVKPRGPWPELHAAPTTTVAVRQPPSTGR